MGAESSGCFGGEIYLRVGLVTSTRIAAATTQAAATNPANQENAVGRVRFVATQPANATAKSLRCQQNSAMS